MSNEGISLPMICKKYTVAPACIPLFIMDGLCVKFEVAKTVYESYDEQFKTRTTDQRVDKSTMQKLLLLMLAWNVEHRDLKILNTLLKSIDRFEIVDPDFVDSVRIHMEEML